MICSVCIVDFFTIVNEPYCMTGKYEEDRFKDVTLYSEFTSCEAVGIKKNVMDQCTFTAKLLFSLL